MKHAIAALLIAVLHIACHAQRTQTKNIVVVTLDGMRWQELFEGIDPDIAFKSKYVDSGDDVAQFWDPNRSERRKMLMPFMWNVVASQGQLYGNRNYENKVNCTNSHLISYPGYSEMLVGFKSREVSSNRKIENPHSTVLEAIANDFRFRDEVAAFATWETFNLILREKRSNIHVNAGSDLARGNLSPAEEMLNRLQIDGHPRTDSITFRYAMEYLKRVRPRVAFIGFDATDAHAHRGEYDRYLMAAHRADEMIGSLWSWLQSQPDYRDQTTLLITTDHGRGNGKNSWRKHRLLTAGSRHIWFAVIGPDTPAFGEMKLETTMLQTQVASTIAAFLGIPYENKKPLGEVVQTMMAIPTEETVLSVLGGD